MSPVVSNKAASERNSSVRRAARASSCDVPGEIVTILGDGASTYYLRYPDHGEIVTILGDGASTYYLRYPDQGEIVTILGDGASTYYLRYPDQIPYIDRYRLLFVQTFLRH